MVKEEPAGSRIACYCNNVSTAAVRKAIADGASDLAQIYDQSGAGTGPCGGSCRVFLTSLLQESQRTAAKEKLEVPPEALIQAVSLFNRRYYWETHEVLENIWMEERGRPRLFYQGLIQAAAALYHVLNANPQGVLKLAEDAKQKLDQYLPRYLGVRIDSLVQSLNDYLRQAREILGNTRAGFDYDVLPRLEIGALDTP